MTKPLFAAAISLVLSAAAWAAGTEETGRALDAPAVQAADAMKLCERLAGTEREICVSQARDNQRMTEHALGATPGHGGVGAGQSQMPRSGSDQPRTGARRDTR